MSRRPVGSIRWIREGVARVELSHGRDPITGERRRLDETVHGNQQDAERVLAKMLLSIGQMPAGRNLTVRDYIEDLYKPHLKSHVRKVTRIGYESKLDNHVVPVLGDVIITELEPYVLDRWRDDLLSKMTARSALNIYRVLNTALNRAVKWRLIQVNPLHAVDPPRARLRELETLTAKEVIAYREAFAGHALEPLVIIATSTGLRPCELYGLKWSDIDFKSGELHVRRGLHERKGEVWEEETKSERSRRSVSLPKSAIEALRPLRGIGHLTGGVDGSMTPTAVSRAYRRQVRAAKLRYVPLRDLRHSHATLMLEAGVDIVQVSRRLGHSTVAITDAYYLRPRRSADEKAASAFDDLLGNCRALPRDEETSSG